MNENEEFEPTETPHHTHLIFRVLPFLILFFTLGAMLLLCLKHEQPTPKQLAGKVTFKDNTWESGRGDGRVSHLGNATVWFQCNAGMEVTDLRNCPEYKVGPLRDYAVFGYGKPKHKRRTALFTSGTVPDATDAIHWTYAEPVSLEMLLRRDNGNSVRFIQYDRDGKVYGITTEGFKCEGSFGPPPGPDSFPPASFNIACTEQPSANSDEGAWTIIGPRQAIDSNGRMLQDDRGLAGDGGGLVDSKSANHKFVITTTTPLTATATVCSDGTIVGIRDSCPPAASYICREAGECFPKCDEPLTSLITRACYQTGFRGQNVLILPANYAPGFTCPDEFESCGVVDNLTIQIPHEQKQPVLHRREPDCKMPSDVDICPVLTLDPKSRHD